MRHTAAIIFLLLTLPLQSHAAETVRIGNHVLGTGDSVGRLSSLAGKPDRVVQLENEFGGAVGERWEYHLRDKTLLVTIRSGRVDVIEEVNH